MAFMFNDNKSFAKHIQESGTKVEDVVEQIIKEKNIPYHRPKGKGLKIDYVLDISDKVKGVELKYQNDTQTAYEKVPHAVFKYAFHNPKPLDEIWLLLFGKGWEQILESPAGDRIMNHIKLIQDNSDAEILVITDIKDFITKLTGEEIKGNNFF